MTTINATVELFPRYDTRKSFYGKAKVHIITMKGKKNKSLQSYNTIVAEVRNGRAIVLGRWSATTGRHIKEFLRQEGFFAENTEQIQRDYNPEHKNEVRA